MTTHQDPAPPPASDRPGYSIRVAASRSWSCAACGAAGAGGGPLGHRGERPVCDGCLLEASPQLGMVMALISVTRACGAIYARASRDWLEPLRELGLFARVYECVAARFGRRRVIRLPGGAPIASKEEKDADR